MGPAQSLAPGPPRYATRGKLTALLLHHGGEEKGGNLATSGTYARFASNEG